MSDVESWFLLFKPNPAVLPAIYPQLSSLATTKQPLEEEIDAKEPDQRAEAASSAAALLLCRRGGRARRRGDANRRGHWRAHAARLRLLLGSSRLRRRGRSGCCSSIFSYEDKAFSTRVEISASVERVESTSAASETASFGMVSGASPAQ